MRFLPAAIAAFFVLTVAALGQTVENVTPPVVDTIVRIPVGSWADSILDYVQVAMGGVILWAFRLLPARLYSILMTMQADQLMNRALVYAMNAVVGAAKDKVWSIDVRNQVLKEVVTYALVHGSAAVKTFMGKPSDIAEMGFSRIDAPTGDVVPKPPVLPDAPKPDFITIGAQGEVAAKIKGADV